MDSQNNKNLSTKIIVINLIIIAVIFALALLIIYPKVNSAQSYHDQINSKLNDLGTQLQKSRTSKKTNISLGAIEPQLNVLTEGIIKKNQELDFITTLENLGVKDKIKSQFSVGEKQPFDNYQKAGLQIIAQGEFKDLLKYLRDLGQLPYYLAISTVEMTNGGGSAVNLTITADTYWQ